MSFEFLCVTLLGLLFGLAFAFSGITVFKSLLPIIGFCFGFGLGVQTLEFLFGVGFLGTLTSWLGGAIVAVIFAALSYLFFRFAIAMMAGSIGYGVGVSFMLWIGFGGGVVTWLVGVILGAALVYLTFKFKLEKYLVAVGTAIIGSAIMVTTLASRSNNLEPTLIIQNPLAAFLKDSPLWAIFFLVVVVAGVYVQLKTPAGSMWTEPSVRDYDPNLYEQMPKV